MTVVIIETRVISDPRSLPPLEWIQEAIPWCTTHDASVGAESPVCDYGDLSGHGNCVILTGGPDHKWWKDTE